jgi:hypothetical protein
MKSARATPERMSPAQQTSLQGMFGRSRSQLSNPPVTLDLPRPDPASCSSSPPLPRRDSRPSQPLLHSPLRDHTSRASPASPAHEETVSRFEAALAMADNMFACVASSSPALIHQPNELFHTRASHSSVSLRDCKSVPRSSGPPLTRTMSASTPAQELQRATRTISASTRAPASLPDKHAPLQGSLADICSTVAAMGMDDVPESSL